MSNNVRVDGSAGSAGHEVSGSIEGAGEVRRRCQRLFEAVGLIFAPCVHEPVLDYETARMIRERFGLKGVETKALLLRTRAGKYFMFVSLEGERVDKERARQALSDKVSLASASELVERTGCVPGCAVPFGLPSQVGLLVDPKTETVERLIFSPGPPTETIEVSSADWAALLKTVDNQVTRY